MSYCEDCGCKTNNGICSNCQEELYIVENQSEFITQPLSNDFCHSVKNQIKLLKDRKNE